MAIGLPVISADCGGMREVIQHNETGFLVPVLDSNALALEIINFKELSFEKRKPIIEVAHQFVKKEFDTKNSLIIIQIMIMQFIP